MVTRIDSLPMKCGLIDPRYNSGFELGMTGSEVIYAQSGKFVICNITTGFGEIAADTEAPLAGWIDLEAQTCHATNGVTKGLCIDDLNAKFILPLSYDNATWTQNWAESLTNETADLCVRTYVQMVNATTSSEDDIVMLTGKACTSTSSNDGFVIVKLYAARALNGMDD